MSLDIYFEQRNIDLSIEYLDLVIEAVQFDSYSIIENRLYTLI